MSKKTRKPKTRDMNGVNKQAFLATQRAATLQNAYMNLSSALHQTAKEIEAGKDPKTGFDELMAHWAWLDNQLALQFHNIDTAVKK
jgi:hypothetical protein